MRRLLNGEYSIFIKLQRQEQRNIPEGESYTLENLQPNTVYNLWLAARSQRGEGASTAPISVRTEEHCMDKEFPLLFGLLRDIAYILGM